MHFVMYSILSIAFDIRLEIFVNNIIAYLEFQSRILNIIIL